MEGAAFADVLAERHQGVECVVERQTEGSSRWTQVHVAGAGSVSYQDTGLAPATRYHYRVQAFNGGGVSPYSNAGSALTPPAPAASAISLEARGYTVRGRHTVALTWSGVLGSAVDIYRDGALLLGAGANNGSFTDNISAKGAASYAYEVCQAGSTTCSGAASVVF